MLLASASALWIIQPLGALVHILQGKVTGQGWGAAGGPQFQVLTGFRVFTLHVNFPDLHISQVNTRPMHNDT